MEHLGIEALKESSSEKRIRKKLLNSEKLVAEGVCLETGQSIPQHAYPKLDEIFCPIEGRNTFMVAPRTDKSDPRAGAREPRDQGWKG